MLGTSRATAAALAAALVTMAVVLGAGEIQTAEVAGVYYQVTREDGTIRQADRVPTTKRGIRDVVRVTRYQTGKPGGVVLSTGAAPVWEINPGRTVVHRMKWDGRAWIAEEQPQQPAARPAQGGDRKPAKPKQPAAAEILAEEVRRAETIVKALRERLKGLDHAVAEAERRLASAKGAEGEKAAKASVSAARKRRADCLKAIEQYQAVLNALTGGAGGGRGEIGQPSGKVQTVGPDGPEARPSGGIRKPISRAKVLAHRVQVWKLPARNGQRTICLWAAHPEAGPLGAFYYVAYADTDGDGRPDKQIARSPRAVAARPGQWTQWSFSTDQPVVFVGNTWTNPWTQVYHRAVRRQPGGRAGHGLGREVYVAPFWGAGLRKHRGWGFFTNLRYRVVLGPQQIDVPPSPSTGSGIYVWEIE